MQTVKEVLLEGRKLLSDPSHWTQEVLARDKYGNEVAFDDKHACQWCSLGIVLKITSNYTHDLANETMEFLNKTANTPMIIYNDNNQYEKVMDVWDKAIDSIIGEQNNA